MIALPSHIRQRIVPVSAAVLAALALSAEGAVPPPLGLPFALVVPPLLAASLLLPRSLTPLVRRLLTAAAVTGLALALGDLTLRPLLAPVLYFRPSERFLERWPPLPLLHRYHPGASFTGDTYGDLAAMSGRTDHREPRPIHFTVDERGFRNDPGSSIASARVLVLGDSFGVGCGTTQEKTWPALLRERHGLSSYNLSVPSNPWQQLVALAAELRTESPPAGASLMWAIFPGNDLDADLYGPSLELAELPWTGRARALAVTAETFRNRSPMRQLLLRAHLASEHRRTVLVEPLGDGRSMLFYAPYRERARSSVQDVREHPRFAALEATIQRMARLARDHRLDVHILLIPSKPEVYSWVLDHRPPGSAAPGPSGASRALEGVARRAGIPFRDLAPRFRTAAKQLYETSGEFLYWSDDTHWRPLGHELMAAIAAEAVGGKGERDPRTSSQATPPPTR